MACEMYQQQGLSNPAVHYLATAKVALAAQLTHSQELQQLSTCCKRILLLEESSGSYYLQSLSSEA